MIEFIEALKVLTPLFIFIVGILLTIIGWLSMRLIGSMRGEVKLVNQQVSQLSSDIKSESQKITAVEKSLLELKADLPREYVRREDHIRYSAVIEAKLDSHAAALNNLNLNVQRVLDRREGPIDES